ncbi:MAG: hypothetical protein GX298_01930 [Planctomycetes bacterium]|nr:hypothetical protein [Planctomycetota bacterium]
MRHWRTKLLTSIVLYGAGFMTAVYVLAPPPAQPAEDRKISERYAASEQWGLEADADSQNRGAALRAGMDKVIRFAEENAVKGVQAIKAQLDQRRLPNGQ